MRITVLLSFLLLLSCSGNKEHSETKTSSETALSMKADSLEAVTDSIMKARQLHSIMQGAHVHKPGSDLAAIAHQNPQKTLRLKKEMRRRKQDAIERSKNRAIAVSEARAKHRSKNVN